MFLVFAVTLWRPDRWRRPVGFTAERTTGEPEKSVLRNCNLECDWLYTDHSIMTWGERGIILTRCAGLVGKYCRSECGCQDRQKKKKKKKTVPVDFVRRESSFLDCVGVPLCGPRRCRWCILCERCWNEAAQICFAED